MLLLGKPFSKWWLLPIAALFVVIAPVVLIALFGISHVVGDLVGPPAMWDRPTKTPSSIELAGTYSEIKRTDNPEAPRTSVISGLILRSDGTMEAHDLPVAWPNACILSGAGTWDIGGAGSQEMVSLKLQRPTSNGTCKPENYTGFEIGGKAKPHRLYWIESDPDLGSDRVLLQH
ncbi:MAG: hypothetical protein ABI142_07875 [Bryocella sp.]